LTLVLSLRNATLADSHYGTRFLVGFFIGFAHWLPMTLPS
jgi:hypothetical protein